MAASDIYSPNWVTAGYSRGPDGKWIEVGSSVTVDAIPPELDVHDVPTYLNSLEAELDAFKARR